MSIVPSAISTAITKCRSARGVAALAVWILLLGATLSNPALAAPTVRLGVLTFGTVNWTLASLEAQMASRDPAFDLQVVPLANVGAIQVALQGGAVDVIVNDWLWVSRQRAAGRSYTFSPYSKAVGEVMVRPDAGIETLGDLAGKRLGVAGGPTDKSWLLLRAYGLKTLGFDLADRLEPNFVAPPLLNQLTLSARLPAALNYWHYAARLKAAGLNSLIGVEAILPALGVEDDVPLLGWVFDEAFAVRHPAAVVGFLTAARDAMVQLRDRDAPWEAVRPLMRAEDEAVFQALQAGYRAGVPSQFGPAQVRAAEAVYAIVARLGGRDLTGPSPTLAPGTFWDGFRF